MEIFKTMPVSSSMCMRSLFSIPAGEICMCRGSDDWKAYKGLPMVGILHDTVSTKVLTVGNSKRRDSRDENSFFACMSRQTERNAVLLHHPAGEGEPAGGVLLELAANRFTGEGVTDGWCAYFEGALPDLIAQLLYQPHIKNLGSTLIRLHFRRPFQVHRRF